MFVPTEKKRRKKKPPHTHTPSSPAALFRDTTHPLLSYTCVSAPRAYNWWMRRAGEGMASEREACMEAKNGCRVCVARPPARSKQPAHGTQTRQAQVTKSRMGMRGCADGMHSALASQAASFMASVTVGCVTVGRHRFKFAAGPDSTRRNFDADVSRFHWCMSVCVWGGDRVMCEWLAF
jgi:hypothetical protein